MAHPLPNDPAIKWTALFDKAHEIAAEKGYALVACNADGLKYIQEEPDGPIARFIYKQLKLVCRMPKIIDDQGRLRLDANYPAMFYPLDLDDHRPTDFAPILYLRPGIRVKDLTISTTTDPLCGSSATTPRRRDPLMLHLREYAPRGHRHKHEHYHHLPSWSEDKANTREILPLLFTGHDSERLTFECAYCDPSRSILAHITCLYHYDIAASPTAGSKEVDPAFEVVWQQHQAEYDRLLAFMPALLQPHFARGQRGMMMKKYWRWRQDNREGLLLPKRAVQDPIENWTSENDPGRFWPGGPGRAYVRGGRPGNGDDGDGSGEVPPPRGDSDRELDDDIDAVPRGRDRLRTHRIDIEMSEDESDEEAHDDGDGEMNLTNGTGHHRYRFESQDVPEHEADIKAEYDNDGDSDIQMIDDGEDEDDIVYLGQSGPPTSASTHMKSRKSARAQHVSVRLQRAVSKDPDDWEHHDENESEDEDDEDDELVPFDEAVDRYIGDL